MGRTIAPLLLCISIILALNVTQLQAGSIWAHATEQQFDSDDSYDGLDSTGSEMLGEPDYGYGYGHHCDDNCPNPQPADDVMNGGCSRAGAAAVFLACQKHRVTPQLVVSTHYIKQIHYYAF